MKNNNDNYLQIIKNTRTDYFKLFCKYYYLNFVKD